MREKKTLFLLAQKYRRSYFFSARIIYETNFKSMVSTSPSPARDLVLHSANPSVNRFVISLSGIWRTVCTLGREGEPAPTTDRTVDR